MFNSIRPAFKQATRASRNFSTGSAGKSNVVRNTALGGSALLAVTYALAQRQAVRMDDRVPRESVLDSHSLKESLHKRGGEKKVASEKKSTGEKKEATPSLVQSKLDEAEAEKGPEGAFNEETGEINWDCPCLGGMADGPCGEQFKAAFSCFVYSEAEPKGMDCVEKFKGMQDCFREHPEIYGEEIDDEEETKEEHSSFTHDHPAPAAPTDTPPANNKAVGVVPREFPTKGETKIKPSYH